MTDSELRAASRRIFSDLRSSGLADNSTFELLKRFSLQEQFFIMRVSLWYRVRITGEFIDSMMSYGREIIPEHAKRFVGLARHYV